MTGGVELTAVLLRTLRFLERLSCDISWWFENLADGLDSELHDMLRTALVEKEGRVLIEVRNGFYCTQCKTLYRVYEQGLCCDCDKPWETEVIYDKDYPDYWAPVTITIIERGLWANENDHG